jgi:hypothetical protein
MPSRVPNRNIKKSTIEENRQRLLNAPIKEKEDFSLQEAIHNMAGEINQILDRGYSYEEIATMLADGGIDIKPTTLRQYLAQVPQVNGKAKSKKSPKAKTSESQTDKVKPDEVKPDEVKSLKIESNKEQAKPASVKTTEVITDVSEVAAKPSKSAKSAVKVDNKASSGFVEMPDEL